MADGMVDRVDLAHLGDNTYNVLGARAYITTLLAIIWTLFSCEMCKHGDFLKVHKVNGKHHGQCDSWMGPFVTCSMTQPTK
jgi:hypothetical protein